MAVKSKTSNSRQRDQQNRTATLQWTALFLLLTIIILAFFVFVDGSSQV